MTLCLPTRSRFDQYYSDPFTCAQDNWLWFKLLLPPTNGFMFAFYKHLATWKPFQCEKSNLRMQQKWKTSMRDHQLCSWWKWMEYDGILIGQMLDDIVKVLLYCYYAFYLYIPAMLCWVCLMTLYDNPFQGFWNVGYLSGCLDDQRICTEQFTVFKIIYSISPDLRTHQSYVFCTFLCVFCP